MPDKMTVSHHLILWKSYKTEWWLRLSVPLNIFFGVYGPRKKENHTIISTWKQKEIANNPIHRLSIDSQTTLQMTEKKHWQIWLWFSVTVDECDLWMGIAGYI